MAAKVAIGYRDGGCRKRMGPEVPLERATSIRTFIVKIWLEETGIDPAKPRVKWHGHVTEVPFGERKYINELGEISVLISPRLELGKEIGGEMS
jgi:hypothetical protein